MKTYAGIGSRVIPSVIEELMIKIGYKLGEKEFILRSGGATGSDISFEKGCDLSGGKKEIFLPWKSFGKKWGRIACDSDINEPDEKAFEIIEELIEEYKDFNKKSEKWMWKLVARNCHQILGKELDSPVDFVVCYTSEGKELGGTRWAIRLAKKHNIKVYNLFEEQDFLKFQKLTSEVVIED